MQEVENENTMYSSDEGVSQRVAAGATDSTLNPCHSINGLLSEFLSRTPEIMARATLSGSDVIGDDPEAPSHLVTVGRGSTIPLKRSVVGMRRLFIWKKKV